MPPFCMASPIDSPKKICYAFTKETTVFSWRDSRMKKRKVISTRKLESGMRIDQSVLDASGHALIRRGAFLDDFQIEYLLDHGINAIYISEGEEEDDAIEIPEYTKSVIEKVRVEDSPKVKISEDVKKRVGAGVQFIFSNADDPSFSDTAHKISDELTAAIQSSHAVAVDVNALKCSDEYTFKHSVDVAAMSMIIGKKYGLTDEELREIGLSGLLHDIGKSRVPLEILNKPSRLKEDEFAIMKQHSLYGYRILQERKGFPISILSGVLQHHEKMNGKGYPLGVTGDKIHKYAKIISVADVYDALVTTRPYKKAFSKRDAVEMLMAMTGELDIDAMQAFLGSVILYPVDSTVTLSNGEPAKVVQNIPGYPLRPKVIEIKSGNIYDLSNDLKCANLIIL